MKALKKISTVVLCLGMLLILITLIRAVSYTVLVADDYWHAHMVGTRNGGYFDTMQGAFRYTVDMYLHHQGAYSIFFCGLFNPLANGGMVSLKAIMIVNVVVFFVAVLGFCFYLIKRTTEASSLITAILVFIVLWSLTQFDSFRETFFWYTGATNYSFPFACAIFVVIIQIACNLIKGGYSFLTAVNCLLAWLSAGGVLPIGGTMCYSLLLITFYFYSKDRKIKSANVIVFFAAFLSTLLNAAAPGNFARHGIESKESMDLAKSIADTIKVFWDTNVWLFYKMNFGALIVVAIICGLFINKVLVDKKVYLMVSLASLVMPFITIFPVVLGYNVPWIPNRCLFITVTVMTLVYINLAVVFGNIIRLKAEKAKTVMGVLVVIAILLTVVSPYEYHRCITLKLNKYLYNGYIQDYYNEFLTMTSEFENQQNCDVIIDIPECPEALAQQYYPFYITDDPDNKFNQGVAWAYGLKSIAATEYEAP